MISFESFLPDSLLPIYIQIILYIKRGLISGDIKDGEALPSRRVLSALLGVNPNTVQKAYALLEEEGLIVSRTGAKSCICANANTLKRIKRELLMSDIKKMAATLKQSGLTKEQAVALIEDNWDLE